MIDGASGFIEDDHLHESRGHRSIETLRLIRYFLGDVFDRLRIYGKQPRQSLAERSGILVGVRIGVIRMSLGVL